MSLGLFDMLPKEITMLIIKMIPTNIVKSRIFNSKFSNLIDEIRMNEDIFCYYGNYGNYSNNYGYCCSNHANKIEIEEFPLLYQQIKKVAEKHTNCKSIWLQKCRGSNIFYEVDFKIPTNISDKFASHNVKLLSLYPNKT